jgi:hypothetical protein
MLHVDSRITELRGPIHSPRLRGCSRQPYATGNFIPQSETMNLATEYCWLVQTGAFFLLLTVYSWVEVTFPVERRIQPQEYT